jgi:hypothetical protein
VISVESESPANTITLEILGRSQHDISRVEEQITKEKHLVGKNKSEIKLEVARVNLKDSIPHFDSYGGHDSSEGIFTKKCGIHSTNPEPYFVFTCLNKIKFIN